MAWKRCLVQIETEEAEGWRWVQEVHASYVTLHQQIASQFKP